MRFLLHWQHAQPGTQLHGRDGVLEIIRQLEGLELPGPAWERDVLPARIADYDPADLEDLCLAGEVVWGRLRLAPPTGDELPEPARERRRVAPTRSAPLAFMLRQDLDALLEPAPARFTPADLSPVAAGVLEFLSTRGASFLGDIARGVRRLPSEVEEALWELVASGLVTGDGIAGLRTLLLPENKRQPRRRHLRALPGRGRSARLMPVGRWALLRGGIAACVEAGDGVERSARLLLRRYGLLVRELCFRERHAPPWRDLLAVLRRLEARGEVRGGRFVEGLVGEQFALAGGRRGAARHPPSGVTRRSRVDQRRRSAESRRHRPPRRAPVSVLGADDRLSRWAARRGRRARSRAQPSTDRLGVNRRACSSQAPNFALPAFSGETSIRFRRS